MLKRIALSMTALLVATLMFLSSASLAKASGDGGSVDVTNPSGGTYEGRWDGEPSKAEKRAKKKVSNATRSRAKKLVVDRLLPERESVAFAVMCREAREVEGGRCVWGLAAGRRGRSVGEASLDLGVVARRLVARIRLPDPAPQFGPDPEVNEWRMAAVGFPLWLWTAGPGVVTDRVRAFGVSFVLRAQWVSSRFEMGDGHSVVCRRMQPYRSGVRPGRAAPDCGYVYGRASLPEGSFTVRATTNWRIGWSALGVSGTMPASVTGTRELPVGELNALVVR
jgi:hypothetical protein